MLHLAGDVQVEGRGAFAQRRSMRDLIAGRETCPVLNLQPHDVCGLDQAAQHTL